ncbi:MAG TPA: hypothetical protein VFE78_14430 [Gemmataceae bacterium]|jgi:hypothetical protein|nr:hypothetical protein [Gemmataceae bacterium]
MLQIYEALFENAIRLGREYGPRVALAVLVFVAVGAALRAVVAVRHRGG